MKIAIIILALFTSMIMGFQATLITALSSAGQAMGSEDAALVAFGDMGGVGVLAAILMFAGGALAFVKWVVPFIVFVLSGSLAFLVASAGYTDMYIWGTLAFIYAGMSYLGRTKTKAATA